MTRPIINIADINLSPPPPAFAAHGAAAERFDHRSGAIASRVGARKLGYNITAIPSGKRASPFHSHGVNEEMFFILEGSGEVRIGSQTYPIRTGDFIACTPGTAETAHQIVNTGSAELKFLAVSTECYPEIVEYPDSGKFGVRGEVPLEANRKLEYFRFNGRLDDSIDYWDGE